MGIESLDYNQNRLAQTALKQNTGHGFISLLMAFCSVTTTLTRMHGALHASVISRTSYDKLMLLVQQLVALVVAAQRHSERNKVAIYFFCST
jgi:hypothetical protein